MGTERDLNVAVHCLACPCLHVQLPGPVNSKQPVHGFIHQSLRWATSMCTHYTSLTITTKTQNLLGLKERGDLGVGRQKKMQAGK